VIDTPTIDWAGLSPYLVLLGGIAVIMLAAVFLRGSARNAAGAFLALVTFTGAATASIVLYTKDQTPSGLIADAIVRNRLADLTHVILFVTGILVVLAFFRERDSAERRADSYALVVSAIGGMAFFVAANNLITLFLGLEWFSISLYILCAVTVNRASALESGLKYLIVGSFGSGILLFGSALVFGATGEVGFPEIAVAGAGADTALLVTGLAMLLVGLAFKASAAPFHQWTPDVYEGAPSPISALMAAATKVAAVVLTLRFLTIAFPEDAELWTITLAALVCVSLAWGNLGALAQRNVKRILAYSSISHAGFLLMPIAAGNELGGSALLYYVIPYAALTVGAFAIVTLRERELGQPVTLDGMAGLGWERPFHGAAMAVFMLGFIGLHPTGIFLGKFYAFSALYERGWVWLMIVGAVFTAVSIVYYLGVVRSVYSRPTRLALAPAGGSPPRDRALDVAIVAALVIGVGTFFGADPLLDVINDAVSTLPYPF
jgi:NADH-quinone oxidoreductase subunit N